MIGRGLIAKPGFIMQAADGSLTDEQNTFEKEIKRVFRLSVRRISESDVCGYSCII